MIPFRFPDGQEIHKNVLDNLRVFDKKYKGGYIDVWWLYDDGGMNLLKMFFTSIMKPILNTTSLG